MKCRNYDYSVTDAKCSRDLYKRGHVFYYSPHRQLFSNDGYFPFKRFFHRPLRSVTPSLQVLVMPDINAMPMKASTKCGEDRPHVSHASFHNHDGGNPDFQVEWFQRKVSLFTSNISSLD